MSRAVLCAALVSTLALAGDAAAADNLDSEPPRRLLLSAAPQDGGIFAAWSPLRDTDYTVRWKASGDPAWQSVAVGPATSRFIGGLSNGVAYQVQVEARINGAITAISSVISATPRPRPDCVAIDYYPWVTRVSFFCSKTALDDYLEAQRIDPLDLRCRQQPVTAWNAHVPDCLYEAPSGEQLLLLRSADRIFAGANQYPDTAAVREHARRAIWGDTDPFGSASNATWIPAPQPVTGLVSRYAEAYSFEIVTPGSVRSRVTWFTPRIPVAGRYGIYHEGHGGAAVVIGAETIDWLLERGWHVIAVDMPLLGVNAVDAVPQLQAHGQFDSVDSGASSPLRHFVMPLQALVDAVVVRSGPANPEVLLMGRSGGGWASYLYAAVDPRVDIAVSIAGGRPISERLDALWGASELGDYEQNAPHLYNAVAHEHLMLTAGSKGSFHLFNLWDGCCFRIRPDSAFVEYLRGAGSTTGKPVGVFVDEQNGAHSIGPLGYVALEAYLRDIFDRAPRTPSPPGRMRIVR